MINSADHSRQSSSAVKTSQLIAALDNSEVFGHEIDYIRLCETHISWVLLTGSYAYKFKKPVNFGFLDFSTLEKRKYYCSEELRLNRRFAPEIYLQLIEIRGSVTAPRFHGVGDVIEYAVKMLEFPQHCLLSRIAEEHRLSRDHIDAIAERVARLHADSDVAERGTDYGSATMMAHWSSENLEQISAVTPEHCLPAAYYELKRWYTENQSLLKIIARRKKDGLVRGCHGDLHLANMVLLEAGITFFDCIEFSPELSWIDCISEMAFVAMDLQARGYPDYCWRFINRYLEYSGDYEGVTLLRYYFIYRALVRAKVEALRADQLLAVDAATPQAFADANQYIELANDWAAGHRAGLIIMHGLSGSGKSTIAAQLAEKLGAIQLQSDVVRKQSFGLARLDHSGSPPGCGLYTEQNNAFVYDQLANLAGSIIDADLPVIIDATCLQASQRQRFLELESTHPCPRILIECTASVAELRRRVDARQNDPSEASLAVLDRQLQHYQPLTTRERRVIPTINIAENGLTEQNIEKIHRLLKIELEIE